VQTYQVQDWLFLTASQIALLIDCAQDDDFFDTRQVSL
jgi:hypothetical protein